MKRAGEQVREELLPGERRGVDAGLAEFARRAEQLLDRIEAGNAANKLAAGAIAAAEVETPCVRRA